MSAVAPEALAPRLGRIVPVRRDEVAALLWSFAYFFCLLAAYYVIRPVRDEMAVQFGADRLQWLFSAVFATMVALIPVFGWLAARLPVNRLLPAVYGFFALNLVAFYVALESGVPLRTLAPAFFVWVSVFNLFVVSVFWSFMADVFATDAARRLFGFISAGRQPGRDRRAGADGVARAGHRHSEPPARFGGAARRRDRLHRDAAPAPVGRAAVPPHRRARRAARARGCGRA